MIDLSTLLPNCIDMGNDRPPEQSGRFIFQSCIDAGNLRVVASSGCGWDHVSVSRAKKIPRWVEMEQIRRIFFKPEEFAFQYHAPIADYVDGTFPGNCIYCLHLWRPHDQPFPVPPKWMVGGMSEFEAAQLHEQARKARGE